VNVKEAIALKNYLNAMEPCLSIQLPDNEPPLGLRFEFFDAGEASHVVGFPLPPDHAGRGAVWDTTHNINNWISDPHAPKENA
jgi:hypothetical protein